MLDRAEVLIAFDGEGGRPGDGEMGVWVRGFGLGGLGSRWSGRKVAHNRRRHIEIHIVVSIFYALYPSPSKHKVKTYLPTYLPTLILTSKTSNYHRILYLLETQLSSSLQTERTIISSQKDGR